MNESSHPAGLGAGDSTVKRTRYTPEQIIRKLKTADQLVAQSKFITYEYQVRG